MNPLKNPLTNPLKTRTFIRSAIRAKDGNIAIASVFVLLPLMVAIGCAIDYARAYNARAQMQSAADTAAVGALAQQSVGVINALQKGTTGALADAQADAANLFNAKLGDYYKSHLTGTSVTITRDSTTGTFSSVVKFTAAFPTSFMGIMGINAVDVSGVATGTYTPANYNDFYLFLDNSPSMGIGATTNDIKALQSLTANFPSDSNCAFACHVAGTNNDYYTLAQNNNVTTRIQEVVKAAKAMVEKAKDTSSYPNQYRMAVYDLGPMAETAGLTKIASSTTNMNKIQKALAKVDLMTIPSHAYPNVQTDLMTALSTLKTTMGTSGAGTKSNDRQKVLFMVTDGVEDTVRSTGCIKPLAGGDRCQAPLNYSTICPAIKAKGVKIAILYTTYLPITNNGWYNSWIAPFQSQIGGNLKTCASDGLFFEVSPSSGIAEAMDALFQKVVNVPRLSG